MFYIYFSFIWLITWLPLRVLYVISDLFYLIIYYLVPYRIKVVRKNLKNSFPEKSASELKKIEKKFYHYFCDVFIETIYLMHVSKEEIFKRFDVGEVQIISDFIKKGQSVIIMTSHYGNWEWGSSSATRLPVNTPMYNVYQKISNKDFGSIMNYLRGRFSGINIEKKLLLREMIQLKNKKTPACFALISDQAPTPSNTHYWTTFLNQDTPVINGAEQLAKKFNYPVVYCHINRIKRGYFKCEYQLISDEPSKTTDFEITEKFIRTLEQKIYENPEYWLWTHNRWKRKRI